MQPGEYTADACERRVESLPRRPEYELLQVLQQRRRGVPL